MTPRAPRVHWSGCYGIVGPACCWRDGVAVQGYFGRLGPAGGLAREAKMALSSSDDFADVTCCLCLMMAPSRCSATQVALLGERNAARVMAIQEALAETRRR